MTTDVAISLIAGSRMRSPLEFNMNIFGQMRSVVPSGIIAVYFVKPHHSIVIPDIFLIKIIDHGAQVMNTSDISGYGVCDE